MFISSFFHITHRYIVFISSFFHITHRYVVFIVDSLIWFSGSNVMMVRMHYTAGHSLRDAYNCFVGGGKGAGSE